MGSQFESADTIFTDVRLWLDKEYTVRENIRAILKQLDQHVKEMMIILQDINSDGGVEHIPDICRKARTCLEPIKGGMEELKNQFPPNEYYRYNDHWRNILQRLSCLIGLIIYLESGKLAAREDVASAIGIQTNIENGFILDVEDYLMGLLLLASDLSRFAVNSVINDDHARPFCILKFITDINVRFRFLNIKNDWLRKKFDSLKFDVKKVEEIVYDLSIRGMRPEKIHTVTTEESKSTESSVS